MNIEGILCGAATFIIIGVFHPVVIKAEYYFTERCWPVFLLCGLLFLVISLFLTGSPAVIAGVLGFTCLWSIIELKEQTKRVEKGWFPANPDRKHASNAGHAR